MADHQLRLPGAGVVDADRLAALVADALPDAAGGRTPAPGLAVAVSQGSRLLWSHCVGLASVEHGVAITADTGFRIASISKQMAAAVIVMLADDGVLGLDDGLHAHLPAFAAFDPPVTLRHLLGMTSGLHEVSHLGWLATGDPGATGISQAEWRRLMVSQPGPGFAAGSRYLYSNANYMLLQWVAEQATGQSLARLLRDRLFAPLGMHDTLLPERPDQRPLHLASGYRQAADGSFDAPVGWRNAGAAGGVVSSLNDMLRWAHNLQANRLLPPDLPQRLATPFVHPNGCRSHYGLGLATGVHAGRGWVGHAGGLAGFSSDQIMLPSHGLTVTVLANRDDIKAMRLSRRIADHLVDGHSVLDRCFTNPPAALPGSLKARCGFYVSAAAGRVVEIAEGPGLLMANGLLLAQTGPAQAQVLIGDEPVGYEWLSADGLQESHASGHAVRLQRTLPAPPDAACAAELAGRYGIADIAAHWLVARQGDGPGAALRLHFDSPWRQADAFDLLQAAPDLLVMAPAGGAAQPASVLQVERDAQGRISALVGHFDRSRALRLARAQA
jgi:CubicO group peptidase (beta-lactamase class C family)